MSNCSVLWCGNRTVIQTKSHSNIVTDTTRLSPPCITGWIASVEVYCVISFGRKLEKNQNVGVTYRSSGHAKPGYSHEESSHYGPVTNARCLLEYARWHCVLDYTWRHKDRLREILHDVTEAVADLSNPTEVFLARKPTKEPRLRAARDGHVAEEYPLEFNLLRRVAGDVHYGSLDISFSIEVCSLCDYR